MKFEQLIAHRFLPNDKNSFSRPLVNIAIASIALGVLVMVMAVCILRGFQKEIQSKVVGFGSHIVIKSFELPNDDYNYVPLDATRPEFAQIAQHPSVSHMQFYAEKGGMIKTDDQIQGIIFKGVDAQFDSTFFASNMKGGRLFHLKDSAPSNEIIISQTIANKLGLGLGDKVRTFFWQNSSYRARAFEVVGIYSTDLADFDEHYLVGDIKQVQKLNEWGDNQVAGCELMVGRFDHLEQIAAQIYEEIPYDLNLSTIVEQNESLFAWLDLLNSNIALIIIVMAMVCIVSIVSALLIMIFEKTSMIGLLKTLGASNASVRSIFLRKSATIIGKGIVYGNIIAIVLCLVQKYLHVVKLDPESYSMGFVPIDMNAWYFILISAGTLIACLIALLAPSSYISHIEPAKTIKIES